MKLTYRGVQYDYNPPLTETQLTENVGKYRGVDVRFRKVTKNLVHPLKVDLMYRGVPYTTGETAVAQSPVVADPTPIPAPALSMTDRLRTLIVGHERNSRRREQSMLARAAVQVGLTAADAAHYDNSGAAMS
jgi:hypothetical protein